MGLTLQYRQEYNGISAPDAHDRVRCLSQETDLLYLLACRAQWRCTGNAEALRELLHAQASPDPVTRCVARTAAADMFSRIHTLTVK